ncbi:uncharacterized protein GIQ15_06103 [Arthroderma uncinatum]|uniref:uncharacterized protein n=1 Tax=Arthroderma uncinatum TaxID=74035 RepID=UPI00144A614C|nr:uncharacterized protein GIQ15_06103 [Arthroderma uncinatum]KAF3480756.1 hypothetical protein GIQ15_06103 [Arthroderma uncinatum]
MIPSSPSKRRKSNSSIPIPIGASTTTRRDGRGRTSPSRSPSRPSFHAPTRSSLARHHPDVLSKVLERSASEKARRPSGQDFSSFGELGDSSPRISGSIPLRPSLAKAQPETEAEDGLPQLNNTVSRPSSRRRSFAEQPFSGEISMVNEPVIQPERTESVSDSPTGGHEGPGLSPSPKPRPQKTMVQTIAQFNGSPSHHLDMKKKQQLKKAGFYPIFKTKNPKTLAGKEERGAAELPTDAEVEPGEASPKELKQKKELRDSLEAQLERLKGEVALLEREAGRLEATENEPPDEVSLRRLIGLLLSKNPSCAPPPPKPLTPPPLSSMISYLLPFTARRRIPPLEPDIPSSPPPQNPYALKPPDNPMPYLTIFAPLTLSTETITSTIRNPSRALGTPSDIVQTYRFVLQPPANFPTTLYRIPLTLTTDPEKQSVISISVPTAAADRELESWNVPDPLQSWITSRLSNPLLEHDISGLCWGICQYWEAAISRSRFWIQLHKLSEKLEENPRYLDQARKRHRKQAETDMSRSATPLSSIADEPHYNTRDLVRHFGQTTHQFSTTTGSNSLELLVSCHLSIDLWTSEPQLEPDICISSSSLKSAAASKIEKEAKRAFRGMLKRGKNGDIDADIGSLVKAVEAVIVILFGLV